MEVRKGKISNIDYENGMAQVVYQYKSNAVTSFLPILHHCHEYYMPSVGENVVVIHLSNGMANGFILSGYWNKENKPKKFGENYYYKKLHNSSIEVENDTLIIKSPHLILQEGGKSISVSDIIERLERLENADRESGE